MVQINSRNANFPGGIPPFVAIAVGTLVVLGMIGSYMNTSSSVGMENVMPLTNSLSREMTSVAVATDYTMPFDGATSNAQRIKAWRKQLVEQCRKAKNAYEVEKAGYGMAEGWKLPTKTNPIPKQPRDPKLAVKKCNHVVLDFGANIGDTSGHVIDTGLPHCNQNNKQSVKAKSKLTHFNVDTKQFEFVERRNMLTQNLIKLMEIQQNTDGDGDANENNQQNQNDDPLGPEDYCYYGIEGNPVFTERLQGIEDYVMAMEPRPIQHMHFYTESVGAGVDGMTKLYLDTINSKQNYWGSSIFKDHQDVRKSANGDGKDVETVAHPVMGYTIGNLMRQTLSVLEPGASVTTGSHLVLKVDIEGGEYPLLHEAVEDGTLCKFVQMGNTADLFIEFHSQRVTGKHEYIGKTKSMKETLSNCGVTFRNLAAWWA